MLKQMENNVFTTLTIAEPELVLALTTISS